jgi:hypothetical protein
MAYRQSLMLPLKAKMMYFPSASVLSQKSPMEVAVLK